MHSGKLAILDKRGDWKTQGSTSGASASEMSAYQRFQYWQKCYNLHFGGVREGV